MSWCALTCSHVIQLHSSVCVCVEAVELDDQTQTDPKTRTALSHDGQVSGPLDLIGSYFL